MRTIAHLFLKESLVFKKMMMTHITKWFRTKICPWCSAAVRCLVTTLQRSATNFQSFWDLSWFALVTFIQCYYFELNLTYFLDFFCWFLVRHFNFPLTLLFYNQYVISTTFNYTVFVLFKNWPCLEHKIGLSGRCIVCNTMHIGLHLSCLRMYFV